MAGPATPAAAGNTPPPLSGAKLAAAAIVLGLANFVVMLDTTIANVSVPHIAGSLGVSATQGTWVITSYAVAEAICVPLTGWFAQRFGTVRAFIYALIGFSICSALCGLSPTLATLVVFRVCQGICGGPLMPLSQTLLLRIFPKAKAGTAMSVAAMTTIIAPILGPILGGMISDNWSWPWIFYINLPVALVCVAAAARLLKPFETPTLSSRIDVVGLVLLIVWVGAFQLMLDLGRERDWFSSTFIVTLAVIAAIGFAAFIIWELTDDNPIVDLKVLRHRGFTAGAIALSAAFASMYVSVVIAPLWMQSVLGYTATWAGYTMAAMGVFAMLLAPVAGQVTQKIDARYTVCFGIAWLGFISILRMRWNADAPFFTLAFPQLIQGIGTPFFMIGLMVLALGAVPPRETASAAGLMAFLRTLASAMATSAATTIWENSTQSSRSQLVGVMNGGNALLDQLQAMGMPLLQARATLERLVEVQGSTIAVDHVFAISAVMCFGAAALVWLIPRPQGPVDTSAAH